ncbi:tripartite tricarboxylate transporter substrate binding protein [Variovorax paradoxus]|nr:tripartite tricarboxylate transporter substrate binding protein [Variovorax paradoxus]
MMQRRTTLKLGLSAMASLAGLASRTALAQDFPTRFVTMKVGYSAGGPADVALRQLQAPLQAALGQSVVIENVPGAGGTLATMAYLRSPADGYTLLGLTGNDLIVNPLALAAAHYKPAQFRLIHPVIISEFVLVSGNLQASSGIDGTIAQIKGATKPPSFGNWGVGSTSHMIAHDFMAQTGVEGLHVPYRGVAPIVQDLIGKQLDYAFLPLAGSMLDMIRAGKLKAVAVASAQRNPMVPDVPAAGESKLLKGFNYTVWPGLFVHSNTPESVVVKLHQHISAVVLSPAYQKWSRETGNQAMPAMDLVQAASFYQSEQARAARIAAAMTLTPQ